MFPGLSPDECRDTPAAANPVAHSRIVEGIENLDDFGKEHPARLEPGRIYRPSDIRSQQVMQTAACLAFCQPTSLHGAAYARLNYFGGSDRA